MKKLLLIDAYAMIYRAYYAFIKNPRINSKGLNTSAVFGFINIMEDAIRREQPTHVGVAFDPKGKTFRHEAFEAYKQQREATPEDIRKSVPFIKQVVEAFRIPILEIPGFEADDVIGTIAQKAEKEGFEVLMLTPDKDYGQLVSDKVYMYRPRHSGGFEVLGPAEVCAKYGLQKIVQVIDLLGLMGDKADNIPGCPGVGDKTAVKLLTEFDSIENLLKNTDQIKGALRKKIEDNAENIRFSQFLATIKTDVPIAFEPDKLLLESPDQKALLALYNELEFRNLAAKLQNDKLQPSAAAAAKAKSAQPNQQTSLFDFQESAESNNVATTTAENAVQTTEASLFSEEVPIISEMVQFNPQQSTYTLVDTAEKIELLVALLNEQTLVCFDTETTNAEAMQAELVGMSFCWKKNDAYYVSLPEGKSQVIDILAKFQSFFENKSIGKIGQNIKYDLLMLKQYGFSVNGIVFDTMIAHYILQPELRHGMDYLAEIYLHYKTIHYDELVGGKGKNQAPLRSVDVQKVSDYACEDADITFQLYHVLKKEIEDNGLESLLYEVEMPLVEVLADMEFAGVNIDTQALAASSALLTDEMQQIEAETQMMAGMVFNVSSPKQVGEVLFEKLNLDVKAKKTKTGQYSTSEDVLENLRSKHPVVGKILEYRAIKKLLSTYIDALPDLQNPQTGKVHTSYNQTVTATGRLSSSNPNLQNIPVRTERGKEIRKAFIPDKEQVFLSADYSQIELRIMAHLSGDEQMQNAFINGQDIHAATAAKIYGIDINAVTSDMRRRAKTANFGIIYGISAFGLSERLGIPRSEAKELIDGYFATYPQIQDYIQKSIQEAKEKGYVETLLHRKRFLPDINSQNSIVRGFAERNAINAPIQGTAADIIKIAMIKIAQRLKAGNYKAQMTMQVHDELNFSVPKNEVDNVRQIVVEEMEGALALNIPLKVDCGIGVNWLEAH